MAGELVENNKRPRNINWKGIMIATSYCISMSKSTLSLNHLDFIHAEVMMEQKRLDALLLASEILQKFSNCIRMR